MWHSSLYTFTIMMGGGYHLFPQILMSGMELLVCGGWCILLNLIKEWSRAWKFFHVFHYWKGNISSHCEKLPIICTPREFVCLWGCNHPYLVCLLSPEELQNLPFLHFEFNPSQWFFAYFQNLWRWWHQTERVSVWHQGVIIALHRMHLNKLEV